MTVVFCCVCDVTDIVAPITETVCRTLGTGMRQHNLAVCELRQPGSIADYELGKRIGRGTRAWAVPCSWRLLAQFCVRV